MAKKSAKKKPAAEEILAEEISEKTLKTMDESMENLSEDKVGEPIPEVQPEEIQQPEIQEEEKEYDNTGKLFLRYFFCNESISPKVITKLDKKVYFPKNPKIKQGWYVTSVIEEKERYGVMDTIPLADVPDELWSKKVIKGIFIKTNYEKGVMEIHRAMPKDKLETEESPVIYEIPLNAPNYSSDNTIENIINSKKG